MAVRSQGQSLDKSKNAEKQASAAERLELASSRGNALSTLQQSLRHHAPAVRASGLKGIRDAVQSLASLEATLGTSILEANLPNLLPNMCRCWLDEDDDARGLAVNLFGDILKHLTMSSDQSGLKCLAPFVPFLCAYASSALNSLDRDIRKDGALLVGMMASSESSPAFSSLANEGNISSMAAELGRHVDTFLPSLERLLSSMSLGRGRSNASSKEGSTLKRKRDGNNNNTTQSTQAAPKANASGSTLLSLALLLRASLASEGDEPGSNGNTGSSKRRLDPSLYVSGECTFLRGGSAHVNSLLLLREGGSNYNKDGNPVCSVLDLPAMPIDAELADGLEIPLSEEGATTGQPSPTDDASTLEKVQMMNSLLETLRLKFVELTHNGRQSDNAKDGLIMPTADLETVDVLVQTIRFVHRRFLSFQIVMEDHKHTEAKSTGQRQSKRELKKAAKEIQTMGESLAAYRTTVSKNLTFQLEMFPITPMDNISASRYEFTNAGVCSALAELGGDSTFDAGRESSTRWISSVFSYILPRLTGVTEESVEEGSNASAEGIATNILLKVVSKLLLPSDSGQLTQTYLLRNPLKRHELLQAFAGTFFPPSPSKEAEEQIKQLASTAMGKTAAMLLTTLVTQSANQLLDSPSDGNNKLHEKNSTLLLQMTAVLPVYLTYWEGSLPIETGKVLASFISLARQWSESSDENDPDGSSTSIKMALNGLCIGLRSSLEVIYLSSKKNPSIFEKLPEQVQKQCVGLIGLLKCPSKELAKSLSTICSKSFAPQRVSNGSDDVTVVSNSMANYTMEVMHSLRKTTPMPVYLSFLIDSCGIGNSLPQLKSAAQDGDITTDPYSECIITCDRATAQLSRFLTSSCDKASTKILPMIRPILEKWLSAPTSSEDDVKQLVQSRAAISLLAAFTWDELLSDNTGQNRSTIIAPKFLKLDDKLDKLLIDSTIEQFEVAARLWPTGGGGYMDEASAQQQHLARLLGPITLILRFRSGMLGQFVEGVSQRVVQQKEKMDTSTSGKEDAPAKRMNVAEVHMNVLLLVLKSKDPVSMVELVRSSSELQSKWVSAAEDIEKSVSGGHLSHLGSKLLHQVKLFKK